MAPQDAQRLGVESTQVARLKVARNCERAQRGDRAPELGVDGAHHRHHPVAFDVAQRIALLLHDEHGDDDGERHHRRRRRYGKEQQVRAQSHARA